MIDTNTHKENCTCEKCAHMCGLGCKQKVAVIVAVSMLSLFLLVKTVGELKSLPLIGKGVGATNTITVSGKGEIIKKPDIARFSFSIIETAKTVDEAQKKATAKESSVMESLKNSGVAKEDIKTSGYNIYPKYEYTQAVACTTYGCPPGKQILTGYEVSQSVDVKVRAIEKSGEILTGVGSAGVSNVSNLSFEVDKYDDVMKDAQGLAIADAKVQAEKLASELGVKLVRLVSFNDQSGGYPIYYSAKVASAPMAMGRDEAASPELPVGENKITSNVSVTYEIQ